MTYSFLCLFAGVGGSEKEGNLSVRIEASDIEAITQALEQNKNSNQEYDVMKSQFKIKYMTVSMRVEHSSAFNSPEILQVIE